MVPIEPLVKRSGGPALVAATELPQELQTFRVPLKFLHTTGVPIKGFCLKGFLWKFTKLTNGKM